MSLQRREACAANKTQHTLLRVNRHTYIHGALFINPEVTSLGYDTARSIGARHSSCRGLLLQEP
jgi:hypothetical protein